MNEWRISLWMAHLYIFVWEGIPTSTRGWHMYWGTLPPSKTVTKNFPLTTQVHFFFKKREEIIPFYGATHIPGFFTFWWCLLWVSKQGWISVWFIACTCNEFLRFTYGATPADLLAASMAAKPFHPCTCHKHLWGRVWDGACRCLTVCDERNTLPNELSTQVLLMIQHSSA